MQTGEGRVAVVVVVLFVVVVVDVTVVVRAAAGAGGGGRDSGDRSVGSTLALCQRLRWTQQRRPCNYCDLCITPSVFWLLCFFYVVQATLSWREHQRLTEVQYGTRKMLPAKNLTGPCRASESEPLGGPCNTRNWDITAVRFWPCDVYAEFRV